MKRFKSIAMASLVTGLLGVPAADPDQKDPDKHPLKTHRLKRVLHWRMRAATDLPRDEALPALEAIRAGCGAWALRMEKGAGDRVGLVEFAMRGYSEGSRATLEAHAGHHRVAVKAYAADPAAEAALYEAVAAASAGAEARIPRLLAWHRELRMLLIGWLDDPTAQQLVERGQGERAGALAAEWLRHAAKLPVNLGTPCGAAEVLLRARKWVAGLALADPSLGAAAEGVARSLAAKPPADGLRRLVHARFYARHVLELGAGPGVIDWQRYGQGRLEIDAGMFLATVWRLGRRAGSLTGEAARAEETFLRRTAGLLDGRATAWYRAAALLRFAHKQSRLGPGAAASAAEMLGEARRLMGPRPAVG